MADIVERLYGTFCWKSEKKSEDQEAILAEYLAMCEKIEPIFGMDFLDRFSTLKGELDHADDITSFRQGLRLGARLALELLRPA